MLYNTEAVVIRSMPYGETHAIVTLLTPMGKLSAIARGAKKPQSRLSAGTQMCVEGTYSLYQGSGMGNIQQVEVTHSHRHIRETLDSSAYAAYFCELVLAAAEERPHASRAPYHLLTGALERLEAGADDVLTVARIYEAKILSMLGVSPDWLVCVRCNEPHAESSDFQYSPRDGGFVCTNCRQRDYPVQTYVHVPRSLPRILSAFERVPWSRLGAVNISGETQRALKAVLKIQLQEFAGLYLKSLQFIESLDIDFSGK